MSRAGSFWDLPVNEWRCHSSRQLESGKSPRLVWIIDNPKAGQAQRYRLSGLQGNDPQRPVVVAESNGRLLSIRIADKKVLQYNEAVVPSPIPDKPEYRRMLWRDYAEPPRVTVRLAA